MLFSKQFIRCANATPLPLINSVNSLLTMKNGFCKILTKDNRGLTLINYRHRCKIFTQKSFGVQS